MRDIKFRMFSKGRGKVLSWEELQKLHVHTVFNMMTPECNLMQYIGLKDKDGVEIYEGDIVEAHSFVFDGGESDFNFIGEVVFTDDCCFAIESGNSQYSLVETSHFEEPCIKVIGNIHQNPELLA